MMRLVSMYGEGFVQEFFGRGGFAQGGFVPDSFSHLHGLLGWGLETPPVGLVGCSLTERLPQHVPFHISWHLPLRNFIAVRASSRSLKWTKA